MYDNCMHTMTAKQNENGNLALKVFQRLARLKQLLENGQSLLVGEHIAGLNVQDGGKNAAMRQT